MGDCKRNHILIVDDNPENIRTIGFVLREKGYVISVAQSGENALNVAASVPIELVLLDVVMPEMDGFETCRRLKENAETKDIPVIFMSALSETIDKVRAFGAGGVDYVTKPIETEELLARVETHLTIQSLHDELENVNLQLEEKVRLRTHDLEDELARRIKAEEEREKLEAQLRQSQRMEALGQVAGGVAHDFNNILTAILGYCELADSFLAGDAEDAHPAKESLQQIQLGAERAATLTRQLLTFSRQQISKPELISLNETVIGMEKMIRRLLAENIELSFALGENVWLIKADEGQVEQVLMNLVVNSRDAMPDGGMLLVKTESVHLDGAYVTTHAEAQIGPHVCLTVCDEGTGIPEEILSQIFEPFFTTKEVGRGTGLGLSTVYGIVKQAGGHISVYSEPGHGTVVRAYFPAVLDQPAVAKTKSSLADEDQKVGGSETILLCEDNDSVRRLAVTILASHGYTVIEAQNGTDALEIARDFDGVIQLLVTDVIMPGLNGKRVSDELTQMRPDIRTLFMSGYTSNVIAHHGVLDEGVELLEKPFNESRLLSRVRQVLDAQDRT